MTKFLPINLIFVLLTLTTGLAWSADFSVNRYVSSSTYNTNSYWLESNTGIALIDAQMLRSDAGKLALLIKSTGKPLKGAIITHAHFDHFSGLKKLREELGNFPIYSTQATLIGIQNNHKATIGWAPESYGDDYDTTLIEPDKIVESGDTIDIAGIALKIDDIGPGESANNLVIYQPDNNILFSGDATLHSDHYYLGEGRSALVLGQLEYLNQTYSKVKLVYTGHGDPAAPSAAFSPAIKYVRFIQHIVSKALANGKIIESEEQPFDQKILKSLADTVSSEFPELGEYGLTHQYIVNSNLKGVLKELSDN